jgi:microcystin-dependent protein
MPSHSHTVGVTFPQTLSDAVSNPAGAQLDIPITHDASQAKYTSFAGYAASSGTTLASAALSVAGNSSSHTNNQPSVALRFCIAWNGTFPTPD